MSVAHACLPSILSGCARRPDSIDSHSAALVPQGFDRPFVIVSLLSAQRFLFREKPERTPKKHIKNDVTVTSSSSTDAVAEDHHAVDTAEVHYCVKLAPGSALRVGGVAANDYQHAVRVPYFGVVLVMRKV